MHTIAITELIEKPFFKNESVICFTGNNYYYLFFSLLFKKFKIDTSIQNINILDFHDVDLNSIKHQLEQSFLGNSQIYWLGDISETSEKKINEIVEYFNFYTGVHKIGFFIHQENLAKYVFNNNVKTIQCSEINDINQIKKILIFWDIEKPEITLQFLQKVLWKYKKLNFDQICILINYSVLVGIKYLDFIDLWLDKIMSPDFSLFQLSKYFFAKDSKAFYKYLNSIEQDYNAVFWTSYWSEQLFRAYNFIYLQKAGKFVQAKQIAYKLPFSFIQYDWKKHSLINLEQAHQHLYLIDHGLKNGASEVNFDLFYAKFFNN